MVALSHHNLPDSEIVIVINLHTDGVGKIADRCWFRLWSCAVHTGLADRLVPRGGLLNIVTLTVFSKGRPAAWPQVAATWADETA